MSLLCRTISPALPSLPSLLICVGLAACAPRRVETLPTGCREGAVVITGGPACESRCTCRADGQWSCRQQPCAFQAPPPDDLPRRQDAGGSAVAAPPDSRPEQNALGPPAAQPDAAQQGSTAERVEGPYRRSFNADGTLLRQDFYHGGRPALRCSPTPTPGELSCRPRRGGVPLDPSCWERARLPRAGLHVLAGRADFERVFRCSTPPKIDWKHARLVLVQQRLASSEKLEIVVRQRRGSMELVARITPRCSGVRQHDPGSVADRREVYALPKDGGRLSVRVERAPSGCGQVP